MQETAYRHWILQQLLANVVGHWVVHLAHLSLRNTGKGACVHNRHNTTAKHISTMPGTPNTTSTLLLLGRVALLSEYAPKPTSTPRSVKSELWSGAGSKSRCTHQPLLHLGVQHGCDGRVASGVHEHVERATDDGPTALRKEEGRARARQKRRGHERDRVSERVYQHARGEVRESCAVAEHEQGKPHADKRDNQQKTVLTAASADLVNPSSGITLCAIQAATAEGCTVPVTQQM